MKLRTAQKEELHIDLTSLIDVVFLLLIFFMVSTTFERQAALKIELPEASAVPQQATETLRLELVIDSDGRMFVNDRRLIDSEPATIRAALIEAAGDERDLPLILRADAETPHRYVVTAMDVTGQLGFTRLSIATSYAGEEVE